MNEKKKKKFEKPEAEVVTFAEEDVIVTSAGANLWGDDGYTNAEPW